MKIDNLQMPKAYSKTKASNTTEQKEDFSKLLSGAINKTKENNVKEETKSDKVVDSAMEDIELDEDTMETVNTLLMFMNMPLFEENAIDLAPLGGQQLVELNNDSSMVVNLFEGDIVSIPTVMTSSSVSEDFVLEDLIGPEILVDNKILENNETINIDDRPLVKPVDVDENIVNRFEHIIKPELNDKNLVLDNEFTPVNEVKATNLDEMIQSEDLDLTKSVDEENLAIKKEEPIGDNKWLNHNMETSQKINLVNEIEQEVKVISNENMENINNNIIQLMETTTEGNTNVMKVQLYPEELGAVNITLKMEDGKLIAKILVDDDYVKQLFVGKIEQLSNSLIKQNINMEEIFVELNSNSNPNSESGQNNSNFTNGNKAFKLNSESMDQTTIEEVELNQGELSILA